MVAEALLHACLVCSLGPVAVPPADSPPATEPAPTEPAADPLAEPEPAPEPAPEPEPEPAPAPEPVAASTSATTSAPSNPPDDSPVVRAENGNWGLQFTFGGLAPLSIAGLRDFGVNRLLFTEIGARRMFNNGWSLPFGIGAGVFHHEPDMGAAQNDVGLSASIGIRKNFRVWRRIAPYVGGDVRIHYLDPTGDDNWLVGVGFGPLLGVEYFIGDRVSLLFQGELIVGFNIFDGLLQVQAATQVAAGGQLGLLFYF